MLTQRVPNMIGETDHEAILAIRLVRSWTVPAQPSLTGFVRYALAFSTLLSSQGADAHRHKAFAWFGGNPHSLPMRLRAVKLIHLTLTASLPRVLPAYPALARPGDGQHGEPGSFRWLAPRAPAAVWRSVLPWGRRNIRRRSDPRQIEDGRVARQVGSRSPSRRHFVTLRYHSRQPPVSLAPPTGTLPRLRVRTANGVASGPPATVQRTRRIH